MSKLLAKSILKAQGSTSFDTTKVYLVGEKGSGLEPRGELQDFYKLKAICQREKKLFKDPYFTPKDAELRIKENVVWKRPPEFIKNPKFTVDGKSRFDINQGELGDCWFLAAVANVADSKLINFIAPDDDQDFDKNYAGIFHFRFWQYGRWVDVVIDDYLPTVNDQLILLHSTMTNELWSALLEKAYAKLNGSYAKLDGGLTSEGLEDLTGGLSAIYMVNYTPNLNKILVTSYKNSSFMGCALRTENMEDILANGLVGNHAYTISSVEELRDQKLMLIRIRNPWGQQEWKGKWSDNSDAWKTLPEEISKELHSVKEDGEFWIEYSDFVKQFYFVEICYPNPNSYLLDEALPGIKWSCQMIDGEWIPNINSGGNIQSSSFDQNPQYFLTLDADSKVIVALMQKKRRILGRENLSIGFAIYEVDSVNGRLANEALKKVHPVVVSDSLKQISHHADLSKGSYCIIPFTNEKGAKGQFLFRIYSSTSFEFIDANKSITENRNIWAEPTLPETDSANDTVDPVFRKLAAPDGEVDWKTLQLILNSLCKISEAPSKFSKEQSRSLVAIFDADYSGKLNCAEFKQLWRRIAFFKNHFKISDLDHSNAISGLEFLYSLQKMRFNLADRLISVLLGRYGNERNEIEFEDYIVCMCKLLNSIEIFFKNHTNKLSSVTLEEWIQATMYT